MINKISNKIFGFSEMIKQHILIKCVIKGFASYYCMLYFLKKKGLQVFCLVGQGSLWSEAK